MAAQATRRARGQVAPRAARPAVSGHPRAAQAPSGRHAAPRPAPAAAARNRQAAQAAVPKRDPITVRQAGRKGLRGAELVTQRRGYSGKRMLTAELLVGFLIVAVRAVADYEPQADGTIKGKIGHPKGQYGPLPILAGLIMTFFLLSFLAAAGGTRAKLAVIAGGAVDLALLMKSAKEFEKVAGTFGKLGHARVPPGSWETSGTASGEPIGGGPVINWGGGSGGPPGGGGGGSGSPPAGKMVKVLPNGKCPAGYTIDRPGWCISSTPMNPVGM